MQQEFYNRQIAKTLRGAVKQFCGKNEIEEGELAEAVGVPLGTFSCYINGHRGIPVGFLVALVKEIQDARAIERISDIAFGQPSSDCTLGQAYSSVKGTLEESAESVGRAMLALSDGKITDEELEACEEAIALAIEELRRDRALIRALASHPEFRKINSLAEADRLERMSRYAG